MSIMVKGRYAFSLNDAAWIVDFDVYSQVDKTKIIHLWFKYALSIKNGNIGG